MTKITTQDATVHLTSDGERFDRLHKAEAHQAEIDIRAMLADDGRWGKAEIDTIIQACHSTLIYVPPSVWHDLMK